MAFSTFKRYYQLTKPGILSTNVLTAIAGYLFGSEWQIDVPLLLGVIIGTGLVIASACVFNNYIDRNIDVEMARTRRRALASGQVSTSHALAFGAILLVLGFASLVACTTPLVTAIGAIGFIDYVVLYGYTKRHTSHGTLVGTISGGASLVAGYAAASGQLNMTAWWLFVLMVGWQMPHFYALAIRSKDDYQRAGLAMLPVVKGLRRTKLEIFLYAILFIVAALVLSATGAAGWVFAIGMTALGGWWLGIILRGWHDADSNAWALRVFKFSLVIILLMPVVIAFGSVLP